MLEADSFLGLFFIGGAKFGGGITSSGNEGSKLVDQSRYFFSSDLRFVFPNAAVIASNRDSQREGFVGAPSRRVLCVSRTLGREARLAKSCAESPMRRSGSDMPIAKRIPRLIHGFAVGGRGQMPSSSPPIATAGQLSRRASNTPKIAILVVVLLRFRTTAFDKKLHTTSA